MVILKLHSKRDLKSKPFSVHTYTPHTVLLYFLSDSYFVCTVLCLCAWQCWQIDHTASLTHLTIILAHVMKVHFHQCHWNPHCCIYCCAAISQIITSSTVSTITLSLGSHQKHNECLCLHINSMTDVHLNQLHVKRVFAGH